MMDRGAVRWRGKGGTGESDRSGYKGSSWKDKGQGKGKAAAGDRAVLAEHVSGLTVSRISPSTARDALHETRSHFPRSSSGSTAMFEVGWSFAAMEHDGLMHQEKKLADFPRLRALLVEAITAIAGSGDLGEETLNVICRRYSSGQGLPRHIDRPKLFEEDVYGCILLNTSDQVLEFEQSDWQTGEVLQLHRVSEEPGICFRQRGPARYDWAHGVMPLQRGERISVTWRWFDAQSAAEGHKSSKYGGEVKKQQAWKAKAAETGRGEYSKCSSQALPLAGAEVLYFPECLTKAEAYELFAELDASAQWQKRPIMLRDRETGERFEALEGRPTISFSLPPGREYRYSGAVRIAEAFPDCVLKVKEHIEAMLHGYLAKWASEAGKDLPSFNYCLANKYENGFQGVGKHSDDEPDIMPRSPIACLSLGATRVFEFEDKQDPNNTFKIPLESGSLILMLGTTQERYLHTIRKNKQVQDTRISLTFRMNVEEQGAGKGRHKGKGKSKQQEQSKGVSAPTTSTAWPPQPERSRRWGQNRPAASK
eukprot:TRINITY_DN42924_c0_g1_i1.p1 TRINITY_DN42924_c0_g1~~TRINITY_DN42924_c0_g1_i1.p1  ORF type:complete len:537 (-),score=121.07 TRINITY_DN42924_c0_g1_i1:5-1615(-)